MRIFRRLSLMFLLFILSIFIGCSSSGTLTSRLEGDGVVAGRAVISNSSDHSGIVISLDPEGSSALAAAQRYTREERAKPGFTKTLAAMRASTGLEATTNEEGNFTLDKVPSGVYIVRAYKPKYVQNNTPNVDVQPDEVVTVDVELDTPGSVSGKVILEGEENHGGVICFLKSGVFVITESDGSFAFEDLEEGTYEITIKEYGFENFQQLIVVEKGKANNLGDIELAKISSQSSYGGITGRVKAQNLVVLPSVEVTINELPNVRVETNSAGEFLIQNIPAGRYTLHFEYGYWVKEVEDVWVEVRHHTDLEPVIFDLDNPEFGVLEGTLDPVAPGMVSIQQNGVEIVSKVVNSGSFSFALSPGNYDIVVISAGYVTNTDIKGLLVEVGETSNVAITLKAAPGNITGSVVNNDGDPIENVLVTAGSVQVLTNSAGYYAIDSLEPGEYTMVVSKTGYQIETLSNIKLLSGETKDMGDTEITKLPRNSVIATLNLDYTPGMMACADSLVYVLDPSHNMVWFYDRNTLGEVGSFPTGRNPRYMVVDEDYVYVANKWDNTVGIYRRSNGSVYKEINVGSSPVSLCLFDDEVFATNYADNTVSRISLTTYQVTGSFETGAGPMRVERVNGRIYVLCQLAQNLEIYAPDDESLVGLVPVGLEPSDMVVTDDSLMVVNSGSSNVMSVSTSSMQLTDSKFYEGTPVAAAVADTSFYIVMNDVGFVHELSPITLNLLDSISMGSGSSSACFDSASGVLFVANESLRKIYLINGR